MSWEIELSKPVENWLFGDEDDEDDEDQEGLDDESYLLVAAALDELEEKGPTLGRPFVDTLKGSKHHNMKELRPLGGNIRILFAFDPERRAILLVAGDKTGQWKAWYATNIPIADDMYDKHVAGEKI